MDSIFLSQLSQHGRSILASTSEDAALSYGFDSMRVMSKIVHDGFQPTDVGEDLAYWATLPNKFYRTWFDRGWTGAFSNGATFHSILPNSFLTQNPSTHHATLAFVLRLYSNLFDEQVRRSYTRSPAASTWHTKIQKTSALERLFQLALDHPVFAETIEFRFEQLAAMSRTKTSIELALALLPAFNEPTPFHPPLDMLQRTLQHRLDRKTTLEMKRLVAHECPPTPAKPTHAL